MELPYIMINNNYKNKRDYDRIYSTNAWKIWIP